MGTVPVVFDISSDEESGPEEFEDSEDENFPEPKASDFKWLSDLIREAEESDDSDEVMVVSEVNPNKKKSKSKSLIQSSDDDCVILDGDPDKIVAVVNDSADDGDELLVVGEKGQLPCRDYPHSRHLCAKFPFSSTRHEEHCAMCHCYVCDSIAPCMYWGTGASTIDHCHATDKGEMWKIQRKDLRQRKIVSLQAPKLHDSSATTVGTQPNRVPSQNVIRSAPNAIARTSTPRTNGTVSSKPQNMIFRASEIHSRSTSSNFTAPSIIRQGRNQSSILDRSRSHPRPFLHNPLGVCNNGIHRGRSLDISKLGSHFISSSLMCEKKVASEGDSPADRAILHNSNGSRASQYIASPVTGAPPPLPGSNAIGPSSWQGVRPVMNMHLNNHQNSLHHNVNNVVTSTMSSRVETSHRHTIQSNDCESFYQNQNQLRDQNISQQGDFNQSANAMLEGNGQSAGKHLIQLQTVSTTGPCSDVNMNWVNDRSQENGQFLAENCQYQCNGSTYEPFPVKETTTHFTGEFNANPLHGGSFENWPFENQTFPLVSDCSVAFEPNMLSTEPTAIDAGMLAFDFETSWNSLTQT